MKLWYQSLARESDAIHYHPLLRKAIDSCVDSGTKVDIHGVVASAGMGVFYRILRHYDLQEVIRNAIRAEKEGYDAFLIGNFSDTGVDEARELLNIPVLGICENSMHLACQMGASFGVVPVSQKQTPGKIENARRYGLERQMVGAEPLDSSPAALKQAMVDRSLKEQVMAEFTACAKRLLQRGAEFMFATSDYDFGGPAIREAVTGLFVEPRRVFGRGVLYFGYVYLAGMVLRYVIRMSLYPEERWFGGTIPIFFHWVLAAFVILFGRFHRCRSEDSSRKADPSLRSG